MTNAVVTRTESKSPLMTGGSVAALVPQSLEEAFRVANAIASSGLAPRGLEKPEQILVAIMAGAELGFAPFQSLQSFAVVNGRPTLWGDGLVAIVRRNGCAIREWHEGDTAFCEVTRPDTGETILRSFSQADAVKAGLAGKAGPWGQYPQRMRAMRARAWAVRDGCADMLRGFQIREEVEDYQPIRSSAPQPSGLAARLAAPKQTATEGFNAHHVAETTSEQLDAVLDGDNLPDHDAQTGEITDDKDDDDFPGDQKSTSSQSGGGANNAPADGAPALTLGARIEAFKVKCRAATTTTKLKSLWGNTGPLRNDIDAADPDEYGTSNELEEWWSEIYVVAETAEQADKDGAR